MKEKWNDGKRVEDMKFQNDINSENESVQKERCMF